MFRTPTVFVLGAGSSKEAGLPIGAELRTTIADLLKVRENSFGEEIPADAEIFSAISQVASEAGGNQAGFYLEAAKSLAAAMPLAISIDNYLESHQNDERKIVVGKLAIAKAILDAEAASLLSGADEFDDRIDFSSVGETWFVRFMQAATESVSVDQLDSIFDNVSIVNFNYDRCIEHFIVNALQVYYDVSESRAREVANTLYVFHPYGSVGRLPWQESGRGIKFGSRKRGGALLNIARSIKTFSERVDEGTQLQEARVRVGNSARMIFLGFAFHRQNLDLLDPGYSAEPKQIYATSVGVSKSDQAVIKSLVPEYVQTAHGDVDVTMADLKCGKMIADYWRTFTD